jgi:UDP-N-acetylmuramoyl-L-alanyl-D-glutamate--2,6-diaminopimelate ligase
MRLHDLIRRLDPALASPNLLDIDITGIQEDSRRIARGNLFVARAGTKTDGARYIADAAALGAAAVVTETRIDGCPLPQVVVASAARAASILANQFHGDPSRQVKVLGITGTNGKTTTAYLIRHMLAAAGRKCGLIGTVQIDDGAAVVEASMTTPAAGDVAALLAKMRDNGCAACAIETSSHALHQHRVDGVTFAAGAFTNLTGDHLDYHKTMEAYADAKAILFDRLGEGAVAVVNGDDACAGRMIRDTRARVVRFGFAAGCDYRASDYRITAQGTDFVLTTPDGQTPVSMQLIGRHNIENALAAAAVAGEAMGLSVHQIATGLRDAIGAPGRLQAVRLGQPFAVLVDYAHTDDALENVLAALRPLTRGKLRVLFGCGGDRDRTKRPRMARTATQLADVVYVTSDNPRTEDPLRIIDEIAAGLGDRGRAIIDPDRHSAIRRIIQDAGEGDVVLLAGKGHENYQILGTTKHHFDDVEEASRALQARMVA